MHISDAERQHIIAAVQAGTCFITLTTVNPGMMPIHSRSLKADIVTSAVCLHAVCGQVTKQNYLPVLASKPRPTRLEHLYRIKAKS
jgi:hypothetical protein